MTIETLAILLGYLILGIIVFVLAVIALFSIWLGGVGFWRILTTKQTIRFMRKPEAKATAEGLKAAHDFLIKSGVKDYYTLRDIKSLIDKYHNYHNL